MSKQNVEYEIANAPGATEGILGRGVLRLAELRER